MSARVYIKVQMTNIEAIAKMCEREGFKLEQREPIAAIKILHNRSSMASVRVNLSQEGQVSFDEDFTVELHKKLLPTAETPKDAAAARKAISDQLFVRYQQALVINAAEQEGLRWEEGANNEGVRFVRVFKSEEDLEEPISVG